MLTDRVEATLEQFSSAFTVRDIMTACLDLQSADTPDEAKVVHEKFGFDVVPYPKSGLPQGYFYQGGECQPIQTGDLISDGTGLLDLLDLLQERGREEQAFFFVLTRNKISGFVHFSDLNKSAMKAAIYMMVEATERHVLGTLRAKLEDESELEAVLSTNSRNRVKGWLKKAREKRADPKPLDVLGWPEILEAARSSRLSHVDGLSPEEEQSLKDLRDRVSHSGELLVYSYEEVQTLIDGRRLCALLRR